MCVLSGWFGGERWVGAVSVGVNQGHAGNRKTAWVCVRFCAAWGRGMCVVCSAFVRWINTKWRVDVCVCTMRPEVSEEMVDDVAKVVDQVSDVDPDRIGFEHQLGILLSKLGDVDTEAEYRGRDNELKPAGEVREKYR